MDVKLLLNKAQEDKSLLKSDVELIEKAYNFAKKAHESQKRKSGEQYFSHSYETALKIASWQLDSQTIAAALLHDVIEDTGATLEEIKKEFGEEVAFLVDGVTKLGRLKYHEENNGENISATASQKQLAAENLRKMILALSRDLRVILIKLADRLHNMKTLSYVAAAKQKEIALETSEIYAPLAYRLGMINLAGELEDLAFPYLHLNEYKWLIENIKEKYEERQRYSEKVKIIIEKALRENKIEPIKIDFRAKRYSSLYKKLLHYDMNLEQIYDLVALRIIVKTIEDCYAALGVIHNIWPPLPGRIKDYIAMPKPNGYRSLHTTVFCLDNKPTEFQIRTEEMHREAENGIAAHWVYAEQKGKKSKKPSFADKKELVWVEQLRSWQKNFPNPEEFLQSLKIDFLKDRIFAVTPKGEVIDLPAGATPVDFAYAIHTTVGDSCVGAKVNNKIVPLDYKLQSGDLAEILLQKNKKPSASWLDFVKTSIAKKRIKSAAKKTSFGIIKKPPRYTELKIIVDDRMGLLKDISSIISEKHINIHSTHSEPQSPKHHRIKIRCETDSKETMERLILKLKKIKEIKEISYKLI